MSLRYKIEKSLDNKIKVCIIVKVDTKEVSESIKIIKKTLDTFLKR